MPFLVPSSLIVYQNFVGGLLIVYGIPIVVCAILIGPGPLHRWNRGTALAAVRGFSWYGVLSVLGLFIAVVLAVIYSVYFPQLFALLQRPNPAIEAARSNPWFWVGFSFVIGAIEEVIFRGWIFGYWVQRGTNQWVLHAAWTSALFAGVHLYYGLTYLGASPVFYVPLFLTGFAFAATVWRTKGNLVIVAALHGAADATSFLVLANPAAGYTLHYGLILVGVVVALVTFLGTRRPGAPLSSARNEPALASAPPGAFGDGTR